MFYLEIFTGDVQERVNILKNVGQNSLAYLTAATHGLSEQADQIAEQITSSGNELPQLNASAILLKPPVPIQQAETNWPLLSVSKGFFEGAMSTRAVSNVRQALEMNDPVIDEGAVGEGWGDDADLGLGGEEDDEFRDPVEPGEANTSDGPGWNVEDDDLIVPQEILDKMKTTSISNEGFFAPNKGQSIQQHWPNNSGLVLDHVKGGSFETAFRLLNEQIGVVNFKPFKEQFMQLYAGSRTSFTAISNIDPLTAYPNRNYSETNVKQMRPAIGVKLSDLVQRLQDGYQLTTGGKFSEAVEKFQNILFSIPFLVVESKTEIAEAQQLLKICMEYILGLKLESARKNLPKATLEEQKRLCEMAAYFTHCKLQPVHQILTLRTALNMFFKLKNYKTAASFASRLLELGPRPEVALQVRKILQACEVNPIDEHQLQYEQFNPFSICGASYTPIYRGKAEEKCSFCTASFDPQFKGTLCNVCELSEVGKDVIGLRISILQTR